MSASDRPRARRLADRTLLMSGGSRGIGLAIGLAAAREGANVVLLAKTDSPDPRLSGTVHCLWPETLIATAAVENLLGGDAAMARARTLEVVADAAIEILTRPSGTCTGQALLDVDVLHEVGITDLSRYGGSDDLELDIFVDEAR